MNPVMARLMTEKQASEYLGYSAQTLRQSRWTGSLCGTSPPPFKKLGRAIRYDKTELDRWVDELMEGATR